jgi:hypothetical protein
LPKEQDAFVVVSKEWFDFPGIRDLLNAGRRSKSTGEAHLLIAPLVDSSDHKGLWVKGITTRELTQDGSPVTMDFMIPWNYVIGLGMRTDDGNSGGLGFKVDELTHVLASTVESV